MTTTPLFMKRRPILLTRWKLSPAELIGVIGLIALTISGLYFSIKDALQLEQTINLSLTQTVILNQGVVNLQREVQLTHNEVTRLLGRLDTPPQGITRFDFVKIQVNNLATEVESSAIKLIYTNEDLTLVNEIKIRSIIIENLINKLEGTYMPEQQLEILKTMDVELSKTEDAVKQLIDRQSSAQRNAIIQTRDSLRISQRTAIITAVVLLLMSMSLAVAVRRTLNSRLQQALEADQLKDQLLRSVSHELRTPLASINGYAQLFEEEAYGSINQEQKKTIQKILINTTQLQGMVNNLLDEAQIEQGRLSIKYATFAVKDLIKTAQSTLEVLAKTKGVELTNEIAANVPPMVTSDKLRLEQILFNLTSNALKFTESGSVHIRVFMPNPTHWALQVIDTGIGIPMNAQEHIFESFWQVDSSATRQYRGSGLGLSIVKQLTDLMNGEITVDSEPEKGSTFTIILPLEPKQ